MSLGKSFDIRLCSEITLYLANRVNDPPTTGIVAARNNRLGRWIARARVGKLLYLADSYHLNHQGSLMCGDEYVAMKHGAMSCGLSLVLARADSLNRITRVGSDAFVLKEDRASFSTLRWEDLDQLSESMREALDWVLKRYGVMPIEMLSHVSCDVAWASAGWDDRISVEAMIDAIPHSASLREHITAS